MIQVQVLGSSSSSELTTTLSKLQGGKPAIVDFWTTRCERCPAALSKLAKNFGGRTDVQVMSVCLDDAEIAAEMVEEWPGMTHCFATLEMKEIAKKMFNFKFVPHLVVVGPSGDILLSQSAVGLDKDTINSALSQTKENTFSLDDDF